MNTSRKIALTYTAIIAGGITLVVILFYLMATIYLNNLTQSFVPESAADIIGKSNGEHAIVEYANRIQVGIGWMFVGLIVITSVLVYWIGKKYSERMIKRIDAAYQSEKAFVRSASHELNNPLTAIQGECEITLLKERSPLEYQISIGRILDETKRIIQLMKHLLFLSRGDEDILQNSTEAVFIAEFLRQFMQKRVDYSPDHFSFVVQANPQLLKVAIENILNNALKYSDEKRVSISLRGNILEIEDQGIGIPVEDLEHIFQPFYRGSNTRGYAGQGIGLSLSLRVLSAYGAEITVFSELNKGTRVKIIFP